MISQNKTDEFTIYLDGKPCKATPGETVVDVARRESVEIPTLCHDTRLDPAGACRVCLVEVEGQRRLQPGCAWIVSPDMKVTTQSERITRHQQILYSMYAADHKVDDIGLPIETGNTNQLRQLCEKTELIQLEAVEAPRVGRPKDINPYIEFDPELCILCARCTRYCDEVESVNAITLAFRGSETTISTAGERGLLDTTCESVSYTHLTLPTILLV